MKEYHVAKFFPPFEIARAARERYRNGTLNEALAVARSADLVTPREHDVAELIEEFSSLFEELKIPDRDGADFAVIVPIVWNGTSHRTTVTLDFGRRALAVVNHPKLGSGPIPAEVYLCDLHLPQNLRHELLSVLVTYKITESGCAAPEPRVD
jgi:hypothetical protein